MWNGLSRQWLCRLECKSTNQKQQIWAHHHPIVQVWHAKVHLWPDKPNESLPRILCEDGGTRRKILMPPPQKNKKKTFYKSATGWICLLFWSLSRTWYFNDISLELQVSRGFTFRVVSIHACQSSPKTMVWNHGQIKLAKKCSRFILNNRITKQHVETSLNPQPLPTPTTLHEKSASKSYLSINWRVGVPTPPPVPFDFPRGCQQVLPHGLSLEPRTPGTLGLKRPLLMGNLVRLKDTSQSESLVHPFPDGKWSSFANFLGIIHHQTS